MHGLSFLPSGWVRTELQGTQEREDVVIGLVDTFGNIRRPCLIQGAFLDLHVRMQIDLRGFRAFVPEQKSNHGTTDPVADQPNSCPSPSRIGMVSLDVYCLSAAKAPNRLEPVSLVTPNVPATTAQWSSLSDKPCARRQSRTPDTHAGKGRLRFPLRRFSRGPCT